MNKVININFQGRVVPIEETAYAMLKQYTESLQSFFANEEGKDEIINDIESRIAELFNEELKKGAVCITDAHVNAIIDSMGRPEEFDAEEAKVKEQLGSEQKQTYTESTAAPRGRLYRSEDDKILGGVCGGLAAYFKIDPSIVRILFAIITFGSFGTWFILYIILWALLPSKSMAGTRGYKRLFRNPEDRMIGGVASGLAAYFNVNVWIPRLIFAAPIIFGMINSIFNSFFRWDNDFRMVLGFSFGGTLFVVYGVLWAILPEANTASEKLEMRGEKVDLNNIKNTIQEDLEQFRVRAEKWGNDINARAERFTRDADTKNLRTAGGRFAHVVGVIFKSIFLFIAGILAIALVTAVVGLLANGVNFIGVKNYFLDGFWENTLAWLTVSLFIGVPILALIIWIIRSISGAKKPIPYLGGILGTLWTVGLISGIILATLIGSNYKNKQEIKTEEVITQPSAGKLLIKLNEEQLLNGESNLFGLDVEGDDFPFYTISNDSMLSRRVSINVIKSADENFHVNVVKSSRGKSNAVARENANNIRFSVTQQDSIIYLPDGLISAMSNKFRDQKVYLIIEVPVGKKIQVDEGVNFYDRYFGDDFNTNWKLSRRESWRRRFDNDYRWETNIEYTMTDEGLKTKKELNRKNREEENNEDVEETTPVTPKKTTPKQDTIKDTTKPATKATAEKSNQPPAELFDKTSLLLMRI